MRVRYADMELRRLAMEGGFRPDQWNTDVVSWYRRRIQSLIAAEDNEDLRRVMSLDLRTEDGHDGTRVSIRLVDRSRLLLDFDAAQTDHVTVAGIVTFDTREVAP